VRATPVSSRNCTVAYTITGDWGGPFNANLHVTNTGTTAISNWALDWTFPGNQTVANLWNGVAQTLGEEVLVTPASWDTSIAPGASIDVGFAGNYTGSNPNPTAFTLNGMNCVVQ
jgi:cellulase/cellobiase CelA1